MRRDIIEWPRFPQGMETDKADMCESEISEIYQDLAELREENRQLRERLERLERAQPPRSWLSATVAAVRSHRIRCAA